MVIRARTEFEEYGRDGRTRIIVTELPYQVNKRQLIKAIADQVHDKRLEGISDLRDETDRNGMRVVIELKRDANPQVVLNRLFAQTAMQSSFSINMLALVNNQTQPKILSLRHILDEYLAFQEEIVVRRTRYDLRKAEERAHLLEGLLIAQDNIDEVIRIIRSSYDDAKQRLMERFGLSDVQAQAICDMRLIQLQGLNREKLEQEYKELEEKIAYYKELLASPEMIRQVLKEELIAIRDKYGDERRTEIQEVEDEIDIEDLIEEKQCVYTLTHGGYIKRLPVSEYRAQGRGGRGVRAMATKDEDYTETVFTASTHDNILLFTNRGRVYIKKGYQIPEAGRNARGTNIVNILQIEPGEKISAMICGRGIDTGSYLVFVTRNGTVKRMEQAALKNIRSSGIRALTLEEGDQLITVLQTAGDEQIFIGTQRGMAVCFNETDVRATGRTAIGVRGWSARARAARATTCCPSPRRATASARTWANTASTAAAASASATTPSPTRPAPWPRSRWWARRTTCSSSPTTARSSAPRSSASRAWGAPRRACASCAFPRAAASSTSKRPSRPATRNRARTARTEKNSF